MERNDGCQELGKGEEAHAVNSTQAGVIEEDAASDENISTRSSCGKAQRAFS